MPKEDVLATGSVSVIKCKEGNVHTQFNYGRLKLCGSLSCFITHDGNTFGVRYVIFEDYKRLDVHKKASVVLFTTATNTQVHVNLLLCLTN